MLSIVLLLGYLFAAPATSCTNSIFCTGRLLRTIQMARIFKDSKTFVDMRMKMPQSQILDNFARFMERHHYTPTGSEVKRFVEAHFEEAPELENWNPPDYTPQPKFLERIGGEMVRNFARSLVELWPLLAKKVRKDVIAQPDRHSLIPVPNGFIVPGGRFRELYYWDTYWIVKGLLISGMTDTARGMIENLFYFVKNHGFVPNGGRIYYLDRSQPPLLTRMVVDYYAATNNTEWLRENIQWVDAELQFWLDQKTFKLTKNKVVYTLAHYESKAPGPRPESFIEDVHTSLVFPDSKRREQCFIELKSAAESGWDFSSRWLFDEGGGNKGNLSHIQVRRIAPVDLNAILCHAFGKCSEIYRILANPDKANYWKDKYDLWRDTIHKVFYDETDKIWYDYDVQLSRPRKFFYGSNLAPLWCDCFDQQHGPQIGRDVLDYLQKRGVLNKPGGVATSTVLSGQQWDYPNAWSPLQSMLVFGLHRTGSPEAIDEAKQQAYKWVNANIVGFIKTKMVFEKYDARYIGKYGGGGEYEIQSGFGWSNGAALDMIDQYFRIRS